MNIPFLDFSKMGKEPINQLKFITPYSFILAEGVCLLKNGALMTTYRVNYPDMEASSAESINAIAQLFNLSIMSLARESGWAVYFDVYRRKTYDYPAGTYNNLAGWLIDRRRADNFKNNGEHYTSDYYISFVYQLPNDMENKAKSFFFIKSRRKKSLFQTSQHIEKIRKEVSNFSDEIEKVMGTLGTKIWNHRLDNSELFSYIKKAVTLKDEDFSYPDNTFFFLDNYLCDVDVENSIPIKIGDYYAPVIAVMDLPSQTYPAIFDGLNRTNIEYRWTTRFIPLSKEESIKEADKYQKRMYSGRKSAATIFTELAANVEIDRENRGAIEMENEASQIQADISMGDYYLGYYTSSLMVWDKKLSVARAKSINLQKVIRSCGFPCMEEGLNSANAWMGMMPGDVYSNIRRPFLSTRNLANIIPLSSAWEGQMYNDFTAETTGSAVPLLICSSSYGTPFFLNLNVRDVGHTFIFGPTGAGKSTLLALLMAQATKYPDANIICIDKQLSSRGFMVCAGGVYIEPAKDDVAFQPLSELKNPREVSESEYKESLMWCQRFIEGLLVQEKIEITSKISKAITETLESLSTTSNKKKTLTSFQGYCNYTDPVTGENTIRNALDPYCVGGIFGPIFDASETKMNLSKLMTIEMGSLMKLSEKAVAPALMYIFRYLENVWNVKNGEKQPLTFLFLDEAWLYLQHPIFSSYVQEWLRTLRKKKVFCIFATQEVSAASASSLRDTIIQQCLTKIYLADESAQSLADSYSDFGLTSNEIIALSNATMKRDYLFKNPYGTRMFRLDLDDFQLGLITSNHEIIDKVESQFGKNTGLELAFEMLDALQEYYVQIGKNPKLLDYSEYKEILIKESTNEN